MYEANYEALANAIILQAVRDFKPAYRRLKNHPNDKLAQDTVREIKTWKELTCTNIRITAWTF